MISTLFNAFTLLGSEWVMWVLVAISIASFTIVFERFFALKREFAMGQKLWNEQIQPWMSGQKSIDLKRVTDFTKETPCVEGRLLEVLSSQKPMSASDLALVTSGFLGNSKIELERNLSFLGTVGANAPFVGLFGTVLGIIKAFHDLGGRVENAGAQTISVGISEALVATAVGLLVAIPAVVFYNYFQSKVKIIIARAESLGSFVATRKGE